MIESMLPGPIRFLPYLILPALLWAEAIRADSRDYEEIVTQSSDHFVFRFHPDDRFYAEAIQQESERLWDRITKDIGAEPEGKILVIVAFTQEAFNLFQPGDRPLPAWASGAAYPAKMAMVIRSPRLMPGHQEEILQVFTHELTHLILATRFGDRPIPRWLNEGIAMYESHEWQPAQDLLMTRRVLSGDLIPLDRLTRTFSENALEIRMAYLQSYSLVRFLISKYGRGSFHLLLEALAQGMPFEQAIQKVLGQSAQELEAEWMKYLRLRYHWVPLLTSSSLIWLLIVFTMVFVYMRRKRLNRSILEQWDEEEQGHLPSTPPDSPSRPSGSYKPPQ